MTDRRHLLMLTLTAAVALAVGSVAAGAEATAAPAAGAEAAKPAPAEPDPWVGYMTAAQTAYRRGDVAKAEEALLEAVKLAEGFDPKDGRLVASLANLAMLMTNAQRYADAVEPCKRIVELQEKVRGPQHAIVAGALNDLAGQYKDQGKFDEAEPIYKRALGILESAKLPADRVLLSYVLNNLCELYLKQDKLKEAEDAGKRGLAIRQKALPATHGLVADGFDNLGDVYTAQGKHAEAEEAYRRVLAIRKRTHAWNRPVMIQSLANVADACKAQKKFTDAEGLYASAVKTGQGGLGRMDGLLADVLDRYADLLRKMDRPDEAAPMDAQAKEIRDRLAAEASPAGTKAAPGPATPPAPTPPETTVKPPAEVEPPAEETVAPDVVVPAP